MSVGIIKTSRVIAKINANQVEIGNTSLPNHLQATYATKTALTTQISDAEAKYATKTALTTQSEFAEATYATKTELDEIIGGNIDSLSDALDSVHEISEQVEKLGGYNTKATGLYSHAGGVATTASGDISHAEGQSTTASGYISHAEGNGSTASGGASHAEGSGTTASGNYSHAEGESTNANGQASHAEGYKTVADGDFSHAEGSSTTASGLASHVEGENTTASELNAHAEGQGTTASGKNAHAEGAYTTASGTNAHAEGHYTFAIGDLSHTTGESTRAESFAETVVGTYNKNTDAASSTSFDDDDNAFVVGIGQSDTARKNGFVVQKNGSIHASFVTEGTTEVPKFSVGKNGHVIASSLSQFTGIHHVVDEQKDAEYESGSVLISIGTWKDAANAANTKFKVTNSTKQKDKMVIGTAYNLNGELTVMSVGEGQMLVCPENGNIENGDFICSGTNPYGMKQGTDMMMNYTIAKATEDCIFRPDETKRMISVIFHCG